MSNPAVPIEPTQDAHDHETGRHGHQASLQDGLDFVNTYERSRGTWSEHLDNLRTAVRWLADHGLLHREMLRDQLRRRRDDEYQQDVLDRIRTVRAGLRELLDARVERRPADSAALGTVNRALRTQYVYELVPAPDGVSLDHRHEGDPIDGALARLAESIARELTQPESERLRVCDSSPAGRRKWCDMGTCGNRAKVARHRARKREEEAEAEVSEADSHKAVVCEAEVSEADSHAASLR
jgi:predicted RNA-binding Zn ribbon-like protein